MTITSVTDNKGFKSLCPSDFMENKFTIMPYLNTSFQKAVANYYCYQITNSKFFFNVGKRITTVEVQMALPDYWCQITNLKKLMNLGNCITNY